MGVVWDEGGLGMAVVWDEGGSGMGMGVTGNKLKN